MGFCHPRFSGISSQPAYMFVYMYMHMYIILYIHIPRSGWGVFVKGK